MRSKPMTKTSVSFAKMFPLLTGFAFSASLAIGVTGGVKVFGNVAVAVVSRKVRFISLGGVAGYCQ